MASSSCSIRTDGKLLLASPLGAQNWTDRYGKDGHPVLTDHFESSLEGTQTCAANASKWLSASSIRSRNCILRGSPKAAPLTARTHGLPSWANASSAATASAEAAVARTSSVPCIWTPARRRGIIPCPKVMGVAAYSRTAGGLVFVGVNGGTFTALDSTTGAPVWHFEDWPAVAAPRP